MDLIGGYLLVVMALFVANIALMLGNYKLSNLKVIVLSLICSAITFAIMNVSSLLNGQLSFLSDYFSYLFLAITIIIFVSIVYYIRRDDFKIPFYSISLAFVISTALLSSQANLDFLSMALYSLLVFIILFVVYQLTKLLHHAKRQYPVVIGEYMSLFSILMFIFALTYNSTKALDYSMFSPFLILTPTYQLIYVIIGIIVVLVVGVLINDTRGK
jgi:lipoprotein signal peptidase